MKKVIAIILFSLLNVGSIKSQTAETPVGWYQVLTGAQVKVIQGNSDDVINKTVWSDISYSANEVLLVFNFSKDKYYCYDPDGRVVIVKGKASLKKIEMAGRVGNILEAAKIGLDISLEAGSNVWLVGYNSANSTAKILMVDGSTQEIPQGKIQDLKEYMDSMDKSTNWHTVE